MLRQNGPPSASLSSSSLLAKPHNRSHDSLTNIGVPSGRNMYLSVVNTRFDSWESDMNLHPERRVTRQC